MNETIYAIYGTNMGDKYPLGHATGDRQDIEVYFEYRKGCALVIETVVPVAVPKGYAKEQNRLKAKRAVLQNQLAQLNTQIEGRGTPE